jgi:hypothetical protein
MTYTPGMVITNKANDFGALGCFAKKGNDVVLLSNAHVLFADNDLIEEPQLGIYQPNYASCCGGGENIAATLNNRNTGFRPVPGQPGSADTDCAIAKLLPGIPYTNQIPQIGMIAGAGPLPAPSVLLPDFTTMPSDQQLFRMYSPLAARGGLRYGTILRAGGNAPPPLTKGPVVTNDPMVPVPPLYNQLVVLPRLPPVSGETQSQYDARYRDFVASGQRLTFAEHGDSGSVVVDNVPGSVHVIGLLSTLISINVITASVPPPIPDVLRAVDHIGVVSPIANITAQMGITIPANLSGTVPTSGARNYAAPRILDVADIADIDASMARLRNRLSETPRGRLVAAKIDEHRAEAARLVNTVRHVAATWQRYRGPAYIQHFIKNLRNPAHRIPVMIDGVTLEELLEHIRAVLLRYASPALHRDLSRYGMFAVAALSGLSTLHDVIAELETRRLQPA